MSFSPVQQAALKAAIAANTTQVAYAGSQVQIKDLPNAGDANFAIAFWYNQAASPAFHVLRTDVGVDEILDQVTWPNFTPADAPDNTVTYQNRAILLQTKQMNLQLMLQGRSSFDASRTTLRAGLNDATTNLPSGPAGASRSGGWANILPVLRRPATNAEKLFAVAASGVGTGVGALGETTNPALMTFQGAVSLDDVESARNLP